MKFHTKREPTVAVPVARIEAEAAHEQNQRKQKICEVARLLSDIELIFSSEHAPKISLNLRDIDFSRVQPPRETSRPIKTARFSDGVAVLATDFSQDHVHGLVIPYGNDAIYRRTDLRMATGNSEFGAEPVLLTGTEAIAAKDTAIHAVSYLAGMVAIEASYGWQHACRADVLAATQLHIAASA